MGGVLLRHYSLNLTAMLRQVILTAMEDENDLMAIITRVRRSTTSGDVVTLCKALEWFLFARPKPVTAPEQVRPRFDRATYQREYMRGYMARRRAKERAKP